MAHSTFAVRLRLAQALAALLTIAASACSSEEQTDTKSDHRLLALPAHGVQMTVQGTTVPAGADLEWCEVAEFPGEKGQPYYVNELEFAKSLYSHHLFVNAVALGSKAEAAATEFGAGNRKPCVTASLEFGEGVTLIGGAAQPHQTTT